MALMLCLMLAACASWQVPPDYDVSALRARAETETIQGVTLSAAVLSSGESRRMFGADVNKTGVQPVWVEVRNTTAQVLWLLRSGTDPDLFSPLEVAWPFHRVFASETNARLDEHFHNLGFQNPIAPGETRSGILFTNPHRKTRLLNVDILGQGQLFPFTLFLPVPDDVSAEAAALERLYEWIAAAAADDYQDTDAFRARLEQLRCCATGADGARPGDPLNVILVGTPDDVASALVRRGFRMDVRDYDTAQRVFGRPPDIVARKTGQGGSPANWLRLWVAPFRYQGKTVIVAQTGRPLGWRYDVREQQQAVLSPNVDEVRGLLIQDLLYSGGLDTLAFVTGVGATAPGASRESLGGSSYYTDGLRAVLFLSTRPLSLSNLNVLDWYPVLQLREEGAAGAQGK